MFKSNGFLIDFLKRTAQTKVMFKNIEIKPNTKIVPTTNCEGITAFILPFFFIPNSTNRRTAEIMKQKLQMKTILEKKRKSFYYE